MKKLLYLTNLVCLLLSGCSTTKNLSITKNKSQIVIPLSQNPLSFDPRKVVYARDVAVSQHIFEGLYKINKNDEYVPKLVERIEISQDKKTYTIHLKKTTWSDQSPLTAEDIRESWLQVISPEFASPYAPLFFIIKNAKEAKQGLLPLSEVGIKILSEYAFEVELTNPIPYFLNFLGFPTAYPVHKSLRDTAFSSSMKDIISNGPYVLKKWEPEVSILLEKNPFYVDEQDVAIQQMNFKIIKNPSTAMLMFQKGQLDWIGSPWSDDILPETFDKIRAVGVLKGSPVAGTVWVICNTTHPLLKSAKMRRALSMSINREEIIQQATKSFQTPATRILPSVIAPGPISNPAYTDIEKSKVLFEEALVETGLNRKDFSSFSFSYVGSSPMATKIAELLHKQWSENLGIHIKLNACEFKHFVDKRQNAQFDILLCRWIDDIGHPLPFLEIFKTQKSSEGKDITYYSQWKSDKFNALLDEALMSTNERCQECLIAAEECMMNDMPLLPLYHEAANYATSTRLHNEHLTYNSLVNLSVATIED